MQRITRSAPVTAATGSSEYSSPRPSARASSSVSGRRVEIAIVLASPLSLTPRAIEEPISPMPMRASLLNIVSVLRARRAECLEHVHQLPHRHLRSDRNAQPVLDAVNADLAHDQPLFEQCLECRVRGRSILE